MNYVKRTVAPTLRPISLDEAKAHLKISGSDEDTIVGIYLDAAINACENKLQTAIMDSRFTLYSRCFSQHLNLQKNYVSAINSVKYYDSDGVQQTVTPTDYALQDYRVPNVLYFNEAYVSPTTDTREFPVEVSFNAGFMAATGVIPNIRSAVLLEVGDRYENRQNEIVGDRIAVVMFNSTADKMLSEEMLWL